ncbi:MAG: hypothetical protein LBG48_05665 [Rickettsiales bacterium]|jgi:hypothetical protein|nr:hypothetical protein [Rickettsiales bacterium]
MDEAKNTSIVRGLAARAKGKSGETRLIRGTGASGNEESGKKEENKNEPNATQLKDSDEQEVPPQEEEFEEIDVVQYLKDTYDAWKGNVASSNDSNKVRFFVHRERLDSAVNGFLRGVGSDDESTDAGTLKKRIKRLQVNTIKEIVGAGTDNIPEKLLERLDEYVEKNEFLDDFDIFTQKIEEEFEISGEMVDILRKENAILTDSIKASGAYPIDVDEIFSEIEEGVEEDENIEYNDRAPGETQHLLRKKTVKTLLSEFQKTFGVPLTDEDKKEVAGLINSDMRTTELSTDLHNLLTDKDSTIGRKIPPEKRGINNDSPEMVEFSAIKDKLKTEQQKFEKKDIDAKKKGKEYEIEGVERCPAKELAANILQTPQNYLTAANSALVFLLPPPLNIVGMYLAAYLTLKVLPMEGEESVFTSKTRQKVTYNGEEANILRQRAENHKKQDTKRGAVPGISNAAKSEEKPIGPPKDPPVINPPKDTPPPVSSKEIDSTPITRPLNSTSRERPMEIDSTPITRPFNSTSIERPMEIDSTPITRPFNSTSIERSVEIDSTPITRPFNSTSREKSIESKPVSGALNARKNGGRYM